MAKRHTFKKVKPGEPIPVTARQLESFMLEHNGRFIPHDYDWFEQMFFIGKWRVRKLSLWAEPEDIDHYDEGCMRKRFHDIT